MSNEREKVRMQHRGRGPMGRGMQPGEKPKDLKGSLGKLLSYIGNFKAAIIVVMIFAAASTVFNVIGPRKGNHSALRRTDGKDPGHGKHRFYLYRTDPFICVRALCVQCGI